MGNAGSIRISQDGEYWASVNSGSTNRLNGIAYGNGAFVVVGEAGTILSSPNGYSWEVQNTPTGNNLRDIAFFNGMLVAVGDSGTVLSSSDAKSWAICAVSVKSSFYGITGGNGLFVAVGGQSVVAPSTILTSIDAISWQSHDSGSTNYLRGICFGSGAFIAVGNNGTIITSSDAEHWTKQASVTVQNMVKVVYLNGLFVALRTPAGSAGAIVTSPDGITWKAQGVNVTPENGLNAVTFGLGKFIAVGDRGNLVASRDATIWDNRSRNVSATTAIAFGNGIYVAVGYVGGTQSGLNILTSTNAINWTRANQIQGGDNNLLGVAYGAGQFVAVGQSGTICNSQDGLRWKIQAGFLVGQGETAFQAITYAQGMFVAVATGGQIYTSPDGINWARQESGTSKTLFDIAYGNGVFVAGGIGGEFLTSADGFAWGSHKLPDIPPGQNYVFYRIAFGNGVFCASISPSSDEGYFYVSSDGLNWVQTFRTTKQTVEGMCFGAGNFVAVGWGKNPRTGEARGGFVLSSRDGTNWIQRISGLEDQGNVGVLSGVTYGGESFVALAGSTIIQSGLFSGGASLLNAHYSNGTFSADIKGVAGQVYRLQVESDLSTGGWVDHGMITNWISPIRYFDENTIRLQRRFYRVVSP